MGNKEADDKPIKTGKGGVPVPRNPAGRPKGSLNKTTVSVKEAIEQVFDGLGGVPALLEWARKNKPLFYDKLWGKLIPASLKMEAPGGFALVIHENPRPPEPKKE